MMKHLLDKCHDPHLPLRVGCLLYPPVEVDAQQHHGRRRHQHLGQRHQLRPGEGKLIPKPQTKYLKTIAMQQAKTFQDWDIDGFSSTQTHAFTMC